MQAGSNQTIVVIGAGPAGLTAAFEILSRAKDRRVVVIEESRVFGGISRTVVHHGNRMDMGGHRFFSKMTASTATTTSTTACARRSRPCARFSPVPPTAQPSGT